MTELHIPEYSPHRCIPTGDAYRAAVEALERHKTRADGLVETLAAIRDLAYRGTGSPADALEAIHQRASRALTKEN